MKWRGRLSTFGGPDDKGMAGGAADRDGKVDTGLTLYEPAEADRADALFMPGLPSVLVWKRLRIHANYIALPFMDSAAVQPFRRQLQMADFKVSANDKVIVARLVDRGPHYTTKRMIDLSPGLAIALGVKTDDVVDVELCSPVDGFRLDPQNRFEVVES